MPDDRKPKEKSSVQLAIEGLLEKSIFGGRWLLAPLYIGLLLSMFPILFRFFKDFIVLIKMSANSDMHLVTLKVLELLDTVLLGNLIIIILFSGYENFVSKINVAEKSEDRPYWMGRVDFSGLKIKLIGSLVAI